VNLLSWVLAGIALGILIWLLRAVKGEK